MANRFANPPTTMTEHVCTKRATYIANMTLEEYKPLAALSRQRQCQSNVKGSYKRVLEWALMHAQSTLLDGVDFTYRFAAGKDFGRMTSKSIQGIPRDIRGFVCINEDTRESTMTDLDMDNCHPVILLWLCRTHGIACSTLVEYVDNRAKHMEELMEATGKSKDEVKSMFLAAVNSEAESTAQATPFFVQFDAECKSIQQSFLQLIDYRWVLPHAEKNANEKLEERKAERRRDRRTVNGLKANVAGSFINLILCTWENRFLGVACETLAEMEYHVCVNNFDGAMIEGDHYPEGTDSKVRDDTICPALEGALKETFGIDMCWSMKRHATSIQYSDDGLKIPYAKHAEAFLKKICRVGSEYLIILEDGTVKVENGRQLAERFKAETAKCILGGKEWHSLTFAETLCRDPAMNSYEKMDMYPNASECPQAVYNLWKRMPCEDWDVANADPNSEHAGVFRKHIRYLADHDEAVASHIELFLAHMLHFPHVKPGTWLILLSEEGAGKGTLVKLIVLLVGKSKVKEISSVKRSLLGSFNQAMLDAFLVVLDEAGGKDMFDLESELKHWITEPTVCVNTKGVQEVEVRSYARFMLTSNKMSVPTKRGDRRGVIVRCSDELIDNTAYFKDINERLDDPQAIADFHAYLMTLTPPRVFMKADLPQTDVQREMQAANASLFDLWVPHLVESWLTLAGIQESERGGRVLPEHACTTDYILDYEGKRDPKNSAPEFDVQQLFKHFQNFARENNAAHLIEKLTSASFAKDFTTCRWRKMFEKTKHTIRGKQLTCRKWDMTALARALKLGEETAQELHGEETPQEPQGGSTKRANEGTSGAKDPAKRQMVDFCGCNNYFCDKCF